MRAFVHYEIFLISVPKQVLTRECNNIINPPLF
ncbi:hypothetical protein ABIE48_003016 [Paenibacillus sp. OAE614]